MVTILIPDVVRGHGSFLNLVLQTVCFFLKKKKKKKTPPNPKTNRKNPHPNQNTFRKKRSTYKSGLSLAKNIDPQNGGIFLENITLVSLPGFC